MSARAVFDTNVVLSALLFGGRLRWLRYHWVTGTVQAVASAETLAELAAVLSRPKFGLPAYAQEELFREYREACLVLQPSKLCSVVSRDPKDQKLLDLAEDASAAYLVTGDDDLLSLQHLTGFAIVTPEEYRLKVVA